MANLGIYECKFSISKSIWIIVGLGWSLCFFFKIYGKISFSLGLWHLAENELMSNKETSNLSTLYFITGVQLESWGRSFFVKKKLFFEAKFVFLLIWFSFSCRENFIEQAQIVLLVRGIMGDFNLYF